MNFEALFSTAGTAAMIGWVALIFLPRWPALVAGLRYGLIGLLSVAYASLILLFFFRAEGGGFNSITEVRALFAHDGALLAGWIHYLAFDLFVGIWIAEKSDEAGISRPMQALALVATFLFGPVGYLLFTAMRGVPALAMPQKG